MDSNCVDLLDYPDSQVDITEFQDDFALVNSRSDKSSSGVWKHFGTLKHSDGVDRKHVYCIQCFMNRKIKKYQRSTSTGNLSKHLKKHHRISLNQSFRIRKESENNTIVSIQREHQPLDDTDDIAVNLNSTGDGGGEEFIINDINEILIAEVAKRPLLYNSAACHSEKGLKHQTRRQLWSEIYESLNELIPYARLPKIWKNIRDRYHKVRRSMENAPDQCRPRYRYYEMLRFLDDARPEHESSLLQDDQAEEFDQYEFLTTNDATKVGVSDRQHQITALAEVKSEPIAVETMEPKPKRAKLSATEEINRRVGGIASNAKTIYTLTNEKIREPNESVVGENVHFTIINTEPDSIIINRHQPQQQQQQQQMSCGQIQYPAQESNVLEAAATLPKPSAPAKKADQFELFGNFLAQVMRDMNTSQYKKFRMKILELIDDVETDKEQLI